jgi:hypothetical protein
MYRPLLDDVVAWSAARHRPLQRPCAVAELDALRRRAHSELGAAVPEAYCDFLALMDGLDWNGLEIYASRTTPAAGHSDRFIEGFVEATLGWRDFEDNRHLLFFGESGLSQYVYDPLKAEFQVLDRQSNTLIERVGAFDELLFEALNAHRLT